MPKVTLKNRVVKHLQDSEVILPKVSLLSRFHKEGLKGAVLKSLQDSENDIQTNKPKVPGNLPNDVHDRVSNIMGSYTGDIQRIRGDLARGLEAHDRNSKGELVTDEEYKNKVLSDLQNNMVTLTNLTSQRENAIKLLFNPLIAKAAGDQAKITELENQKKEALANLAESQAAYMELFKKQLETFNNAESLFNKMTTIPPKGTNDIRDPAIIQIADRLKKIADKGSEELNEQEMKALQDSLQNDQVFRESLQKAYQARLEKGLGYDKGWLAKTHGLGDNLQTKKNDKGETEFSFDMAVFSRKNSIKAIDDLFIPNPDGTVSGGIDNIKFDQSYMDAYKNGYLSEIFKKMANGDNGRSYSFNDALFDLIRGLMARAVVKDLNEHVAQKNREKDIRNDEGFRDFMRKTADRVPPIDLDDPTQLAAFEKECQDRFPERKIKASSDVPPQGVSAFIKNWTQSDLNNSVLKHEKNLMKSMLQEYRNNKTLGAKSTQSPTTPNGSAVNIHGNTGTTPNNVTPPQSPSIGFRRGGTV